jgi:hypothetical protein
MISDKESTLPFPLPNFVSSCKPTDLIFSKIVLLHKNNNKVFHYSVEKRSIEAIHANRYQVNGVHMHLYYIFIKRLPISLTVSYLRPPIKHLYKKRFCL